MSEVETLIRQVTELKDRFEMQSDKHKYMHRNLRYIVFSLTAVSTLLAAISTTLEDIQPWLSLGIVVCTASIGIITSVEGIRKPSELWVMERSIYHSLSDLLREVEFQSSKSEALDCDIYFDRLQSILTNSKEHWHKNVVQSKK